MFSHECSCNSAVDFHRARNQVLKSHNPMIWLDRDGLEMSLGKAMKDVDEYINASLWMDANPFTYLREYFSGFEWKWYKNLKEEEFAQVLGNSDYIWAGHGITHFGGEVITAKQIRRKKEPRCLCYYTGGTGFEEDKNRLRQIIPKIGFVINGYREKGVSYANTKIE